MLVTASKKTMFNAQTSREKQVFSYFTAAIFTELYCSFRFFFLSCLLASNNHQFFFFLSMWYFFKCDQFFFYFKNFTYKLMIRFNYLLVTFIPKTAGCWFCCLFCSANDVVRGLPLIFRYLYKLKMPLLHYTVHSITFVKKLCDNF